MGLTKPRAAQIYNLDYKQATRVVTVANITLAGGAPSTVDSVSLSLNDRVLVTGQSTGSQNGLYKVTTVGSGSNGTWVRTSDANDTGEIEAGMIIMVTEGTVYHDTQWKLTTDDPIVIGTTALTFTQNYSANSISGGTSNVTVLTNANVTISSAGTANVLVISSTGTIVTGTESVTGNITGGNVLTGGLISATGNVTGNYFLGNVFYANGITASKIYSGTSEVNVTASGGNVNVSIGGTSNVAVFTTAGEYVTGVISASGNVTGGNVLFGSGIVSGTGNVTGGNVLFGSGIVSGTGNITGNVITSTTLNSTTVSASGNVTGGNILFGSGIVSGTGNVTGGNVLFGSGIVSGTGNVTAGNILTGGVVSATGNVTGNYINGNIYFANGFSASKIFNGTSEANIGTSGGNANISIGGTSNVAVWSTTGEYITGLQSVTGNITGGNILSSGRLSVVGNIVQSGSGAYQSWSETVGATAAGTVQANAYAITTTSVQFTTVATGSGAILPSSATVGQLAFVANDAANALLLYPPSGGVIDQAAANTAISVSGLGMWMGIALTASNWTTISPDTVGTTNQITVTQGNGIVTLSLPATVTTTTLSATGNVIGGNISTVGLVTATGNVTGGNVLTGGLISATANITGGNILTGGLMSSTGNATHGNVLTGGLISATGNATVANLFVNNDTVMTGNLTVNGNITYINSNVITTNEKSITLANNQSTAANVDGAGIDVGNTTIAYWRFNNATTSWQSNIGLTPAANATLALGGASNYWGTLYANSVLSATTISAVGNAIVGNISATNHTGTTVSVTGTTTASSVVGGVITGTSTSVTGTTTASSVVGGVITGTSTSVTGTTTASSVVGGVITGSSTSVTGTTTAASVVGGVMTGTSVSTTGNVTGNYYIGNGSALTGINTFNQIFVTGTGTVNASGLTSNITFTAGNNISLTSAANIITIAYSSSGSSSIFATGGDMGLVSQAVTASEDLGSVVDLASLSYDLGTLFNTVTYNQIDMTGFTSNINTGNLNATGLVSAAGNVSGGNLIVTGNIVDTGALTIITGSNGNIALAPNGTGNVTTTANVSVTGNIIGNNITAANTIGGVTSTALAALNINLQQNYGGF